MLNSPILLPNDTINKCDYFFLTKDNPVLNWPERAVYTWNKSNINNKNYTKTKCTTDYGWANIYQVKKLSEFALTYQYDYFYHIIYDLIIDDVVIDAFNSDKKCNFYHFHEFNVSLHLMCFDREHIIKFLPYLTIEYYLKNGGITEKWLYDLLLENKFDYIIENFYVDDKILFVGNSDIFNYSTIENLKFFIVKDETTENNIQLFFYDIEDNLKIKINESENIISNGDLIDLRFKNDIINTTIEYNNNSQNITDDIRKVVHNTINISDI